MSDGGAGSRELLRDVTAMLVEDASQVRVDAFEEDDTTIVLELSVGEGDYGTVIGRGGRTANALRMIVKAAAVRDGRRVLVDIVD